MVGGGGRDAWGGVGGGKGGVGLVGGSIWEVWDG